MTTAGALTLVIGDVCGKGAHAAGVTALARHTLRAAAFIGQPLEADAGHAPHRAQTPCRVSRALHRVPCRGHPDRDGAHLEVALAGHPPPLIVTADGRARFTGADRNPARRSRARSPRTLRRSSSIRGDAGAVHGRGDRCRTADQQPRRERAAEAAAAAGNLQRGRAARSASRRSRSSAPRACRATISHSSACGCPRRRRCGGPGGRGNVIDERAAAFARLISQSRRSRGRPSPPTSRRARRRWTDRDRRRADGAGAQRRRGR